MDKQQRSLKIYNRIHSVPENDWRLIIGEENLLMHAPYLMAVEEYHRRLMDFRYVIVYEAEVPVMTAYFQVLDFYGQELVKYIPTNNWSGLRYRFYSTVQRFVDCTLKRRKWKLLTTGNSLLTAQHGVFFKDKTDQEQQSLLHYVLKTIADDYQGYEEINAYLITDFYEQQYHSNGAIGQKYQKFEAEADMILHLDEAWNGFDDYLAAFSSKYRVRANKTYEKSKDLVCRSLDLQSIKTEMPSIKRLFEDVSNKAKFKLGDSNVEYLIGCKKALEDKFRVEAYYLENEMVGFISSFSLDNCLEIHFVGLDYSVNNEYAVYQRILYDNVRYAMKHGLNHIRFGRTAPEIKSTIGARPYHMFCYLKHISFLTNATIKPFLAYLKPEDWQQRKPFKADYYEKFKS